MDDKYIEKDYGYINRETGEIFTADELYSETLEEIKEKASTLLEVGSEAGKYTRISINTKASNTDDFVSIKPKGYKFKKVFQRSLDALFKVADFSFSELAFMMRVMPYINFPQNCVIINGKNPKVDELGKLLGISRQTMTQVLNGLEQKDVIRRVKQGTANVIYFNPFLICSGRVISKECYLLFKDSFFNPKR